MQEARKFVKSIVGYSIPSWIGFVIGIASVPILTRLLSPDQFAIISQFNAAVSLFLGIVCLGFDSAFVRYFFEPPEAYTRDNLLTGSIVVAFGVLFFLSIASIPFYKHISVALFAVGSEFVTVFFIVAIFSQIVVRYFTILYRMQNLIIAFSIATISIQLISKFAVLLSIPFNGDENILIGAVAVGLLFLSIGIIISDAGKHLSISNFKPVWLHKEYRKYSFGSWLTPTIIYANIYLSQIIIRHYLGNNALGIYLSANLFASVLAALQGGFVNFWSVYMFENYRTKQPQIKKVHDLACLGVVLILSFFILGRDIIYFLIGNEYHGSKPLFAMVLTAPLFLFISETTSYGISIEKKSYLTFYSYLVFFLLNIILSIILIPSLGLHGAALSLMLSGLANFILLTLFGQRFYKTIIDPRKTIVVILIILLLSFINYYSRSIFFNIVFVMVVNIVVVLLYKRTIITYLTLVKKND